jgi:surfactin synthase thioesterase subunit
LSEDLEVCAVQLPGREHRLREPFARDLPELVEGLTEAVRPWAQEMPFAFFGHSMGALVAFEVARRLQDQHRQQPVCLQVSGRNGPTWLRPPGPTQWDDAALVAEMRRLQGTDPAILENADLLTLMLPVLRADYLALQAYRYQPGAPLRCPIIAFGGIQDPETSPAGLEAWKEQTDRGFELHLFPGHHFYLSSCRHLLLGMITNLLRR